VRDVLMLTTPGVFWRARSRNVSSPKGAPESDGSGVALAARGAVSAARAIATSGRWICVVTIAPTSIAAMEMLKSDAIVLVLVFIEFLYPNAPPTFPVAARFGQCNFDTGSTGPSRRVASVVKHIITHYLR
jgi:hypothetical protein